MSWRAISSSAGTAARFSARVLPVTVSTSPCSRPARSSSFITTGTPPIACRLAIAYGPCGCRLASSGTRSPTSWMRSIVIGTWASRAIGQQMQVHVGRAAHGVDRRDGVLEGALGHDVARPDAGGDQAIQGVDRGARLRADIGVNVAACIVVGRMRGAARQHHADRLGDRAHRVGREHRAAGAAARHHVALELEQFIRRDPAGLLGCPAFGIVHDREIGAFACPDAEVHLPRRTGARIQHQSERIGPRQRHQGGGARLVTAGDHDHRIAVMRVMADLEAIRDDVTGHQAVACRRSPLGQRIGHRRRADDQPLAAAFGEDFDQQVS